MRTIDADELKALYEDLDDDLHLSVRVAKANIDDMPTVDAEPVVRCKDCKWIDLCKDPEWYEYKGPKGFCSYGKRKDEAEE